MINISLNLAVHILRRLIAERDNFVANQEGVDPFLSPGCIDCTSGQVPNRLSTGLCPYHMAQAFVRRHKKGVLDGHD